MYFFPPQSFSDFLLVMGVLFLVFVPGFYLLGRLIWALGFGPQATTLADKMERIRDAVAPTVASSLFETSKELERQSRWPFNHRGK